MYVPEIVFLAIVSVLGILMALLVVSGSQRTEARKLAEKFKKELDERPVKTIIYGK